MINTIDISRRRKKKKEKTITNTYTKRIHAQIHNETLENNIIITSKENLKSKGTCQIPNTKYVLNTEFKLFTLVYFTFSLCIVHCVLCAVCSVYRFGKWRVFDAKMHIYVTLAVSVPLSLIISAGYMFKRRTIPILIT